MTQEEVKTEVVDESPKEEGTQTPQFTEIEVRAMEMGWRPKDEFNGSEDDFIEAKEFVRRKPLFDKIESTSRELKQVRKALEAFKTHYTVVKETEFNRAMAALKEARKEALANNDGDQFERIDAEIKVVERQAAEMVHAKNTPIVQDEPQVPVEFTMWKERNPWYDKKRFMRTFADDIGNEFHKQGMTPSEVLKKVEQEVKKKFPDEFTNPRKAQAPDVDSSRSSSGSRKSDDIELTPLEKDIMNTLVRGGHITKEKYIADLKAIRQK